MQIHEITNVIGSKPRNQYIKIYTATRDYHFKAHDIMLNIDVERLEIVNTDISIPFQAIMHLEYINND